MVLENFLIDVDVLWDRVGKELYEKPEARAGRKMRVRVVNKGVVEDLTGYTLNLGWKSSTDETKFGLDAFTAVDATKGIYEIAYTSGMLSNFGYLIGTLQLVPTVGNAIESNNFVITVTRSAVDADAIQSDTSFTALAAALITVNGWNDRIDAVEQGFIDKANNLDTIYPTRLVSVEQQLAQSIAMQTGLLAFKGSATTAVITAETGMVTGDYWYSTDGLTYYAYTGTAWANVGSSLKELSDIRVGANGKTYTSASESIKAISKGDNILSEAVSLDKLNFKNYSLINDANGALVQEGRYSNGYTAYLPVYTTALDCITVEITIDANTPPILFPLSVPAYSGVKPLVFYGSGTAAMAKTKAQLLLPTTWTTYSSATNTVRLTNMAHILANYGNKVVVSMLKTDYHLWAESIDGAQISIPIKEFISSDNLKGGIDGNKLLNRSVPSTKVLLDAYVKKVVGKNMFDKSKATVGFILSTVDGKTLTANAGQLSALDIPVVGGQSINLSNIASFYEFNEDGVLLQAYAYPSFTGNTITLNAATTLLNFSTNSSVIDTLQLEYGSSGTAYEPYSALISSADLPVLSVTEPVMEIQLPNNITCITGEAFTIYWENVVKFADYFTKGTYNVKGKRANGDPEGTLSTVLNQVGNAWHFVPSSAEVFDYRFDLYDVYTGEVIATKVVTFNVIAKQIATPKAIVTVTVGDSWSDAGNTPEYLATFLAETTDLTATFIGTKQSPSNPALYTDANNGWDFLHYYNYQTFNGYTNPFYNPTTGLFDFNYYMETYHPGVTHVDYVLLPLGLNDYWRITNSTLIAQKSNYLLIMNHIISSVKAFDATTKIIFETVPQMGHGNAYTNRNGYDDREVKYSQELWNSYILSFDTVENRANGIHIAPASAVFSPSDYLNSITLTLAKYTTDTQKVINDIHPIPNGYKVVSDVFRNTILGTL